MYASGISRWTNAFAGFFAPLDSSADGSPNALIRRPSHSAPMTTGTTMQRTTRRAEVLPAAMALKIGSVEVVLRPPERN